MATDYDELPQLDAMPVLLTDRAPGASLAHLPMFNSRGFLSWAKEVGPATYALPHYAAAWFLKRDRDKVHTKAGVFEHRFGLADPTDELVAELGDEVMNTDPIELNPEHVEGWDVASSPMPRNRVVYETMNAKDLAEIRSLLRERQGGAPAFVR